MSKHENKKPTPAIWPHQERVLDAAVRQEEWRDMLGQEGTGTPERKTFLIKNVRMEAEAWEARAQQAKTDLMKTRMDHVKEIKQQAERESAIWSDLRRAYACLGVGVVTLGLASAALLVMHRRASA